MGDTGYIIPKGWKVLVWFRSVHLDPEIYPDPMQFNPNRWNVSCKVLFLNTHTHIYITYTCDLYIYRRNTRLGNSFPLEQELDCVQAMI